MQPRPDWSEGKRRLSYTRPGLTELEFILENPGERRAVAFPSPSFVVGSDESCQLRFTEGLLQPRHAEVVRDLRGQWWIRDLVATGAVVVNGTPILDERLAPGDKVRIGAVVLSVQDSGVDKRARTVSGETPLPPSEAPARTELMPGVVIDRRYRVLGRIAAGGMGEVYRAEHVGLGKALALKVMLPELSGDEEFVGRFKREAIAASRIGQHNIVDISDFGRTEDGRFYFVMEYLDGLTLSKTLRRDGPFSPQRLVHVGLQTARPLAAAPSPPSPRPPRAPRRCTPASGTPAARWPPFRPPASRRRWRRARRRTRCSRPGLHRRCP